ncbi:MAG: ABC transporter permease [Tetragenococcus sp.]|nr:ABC transporter permease [Tetragenococcus sp.]
MFDVFILQWKRLMKKPFLVVMFTGLTVLFVFFTGNIQMDSSVEVQVYSNDLANEELDEWVDRLNEDEAMVFEATDYETAEEDVRMNDSPFALEIDEETYRFLVGHESEHLQAVDQHVRQVFSEYYRLEEVREDFPDSDIEVEELIAVEDFESDGAQRAVTGFQLYMLIGMVFYFSVFTILFLQTNLLEEKRAGTWNRLIMTPLKKTQIYLGNLFHYFLVGLFQIVLSFFILTNLLGINIGTNYIPMIAVVLSFTFAIVSLGILLISVVPTPQSLQVTIPIVTTAMAMLGGAFWPIDVVQNRFIVFLGELMPIKHGIESMNNVIIEGSTLTEIFQPLGILLLMGTLFMGIGINLMERSTQT